MFSHLGRITTRFRWLIVGLWIVAIVVVLPFAPQAPQVLHSGGFVNPDSESERAVNLLVQKLHFNPTIVQIIFTSQRYSADRPEFTQETQQTLTRVLAWSEVSGLISFTDNPRQISIDRHSAYVNVLLKADPDTAPKLLPELNHRLQAVPDLQTQIGGGPVFFADIQLVSEHDLRRAEILAFPFALIALLLVFRSVVAAMLPAFVGGSAVLVSLALIFGLGHFTTLSIFVLNITTLFGLGLGVDYSLFMVSRFREELAHGHCVDDAVTETVTTAGRAVTFSGLTVSTGLLGLTFFRIKMTLLSAALAIIGTRINAFPVRLPNFWKRQEVSNADTVHDPRGSIEHRGFWYLRVSIGDWSVQGVTGRDHLVAEMANYSMHVDVLGRKPAVLHNGNGLITYGLGGFSYYYSRTRMVLSGLLIDHHQLLHMHGVVWMDHQWGNFLTLGGGGWDWFSIQLNNDTEMMLYLIRDASGKIISTYVESIGPHADIHLLPSDALHVDVLNHWKSPVTGANYPSGWYLRVTTPQLQSSLTLIPELKDQELVVFRSTGNSYWEGAVSIQGQNAGQVVQGEGYIELTGYTA